MLTNLPPEVLNKELGYLDIAYMDSCELRSLYEKLLEYRNFGTKCNENQIRECQN